MSDKFKPLKLEDFNLSSEELKTLVAGAQSFLSPMEDPQDDEFFSPVDQTNSEDNS